MGLFDILRRRKEPDLDRPLVPPDAETTMAGSPFGPSSAQQAAAASAGLKAQMDLILSQMESLRMQYEAINSRLQNIERVVNEVRGFCR